jgi:hypothetical protein
MFVAIVAIWAIVIPVAVLAISWQAPDRLGARGAQANESLGAGMSVTAVHPRARRPARLSRVVGRRSCPELMGDARRRPTSA